MGLRFEREEVLRVVEELGLQVRQTGRELRGHCPNPDHPKKPGPGSWQIALEGDRAGLHKCYGCSLRGNLISLVQVVRGIGRAEATSLVRGRSLEGGVRLVEGKRVEEAKRLNYPEGSVALWKDVPSDLEPARRYLLGRGFRSEDIAAHRIAAVPEDRSRYSGRIIVPVFVDGEMVDFVARLFVERKGTTPKALSGRIVDGARKELALWNYDRLDRSLRIVYVVEGVWGAQAMIRAGLRNVVAACGSAWSEERTNLLADFDTVVLIPDGDAAGSKLIERAAGLRYLVDLRAVNLGKGRQPDDLEPIEILGLFQASTPVTPLETTGPVDPAPIEGERYSLKGRRWRYEISPGTRKSGTRGRA